MFELQIKSWGEGLSLTLFLPEEAVQDLAHQELSFPPAWLMAVRWKKGTSQQRQRASVWRKESDKMQFSDRLYKSDHIANFLAALLRGAASEYE